MITFTDAHKSVIRHLANTSREFFKNLHAECITCGGDALYKYDTALGYVVDMCPECYRKVWENTVCDICGEKFGEGVMARDRNDEFKLMCPDCFKEIWS